jgi:putative component of toxin-antitoxin plasmid stabilization module
MCNFALLHIDQVKGKIKFYKLEIDGKCLFDEFCNNLKGKREISKLKRILTRMDLLSNQNRLNPEQYKELVRPASDQIKDYEIKVKPYRVYFFKDECGNIVVLGGTKNSQPKDIKRFRKIKFEYFTFKNNK